MENKVIKKEFICSTCKKAYQSNSGLWKHQKLNKCKKSDLNNEIPINTQEIKQTIDEKKQEIKQTINENKQDDVKQTEKTLKFKKPEMIKINPVYITVKKDNTIKIKDVDIVKWSPQRLIDDFNLGKSNKKYQDGCFTSIHYGQQRSGKTTVIMQIVKEIQKYIDKIYIFTTTFDNQDDFKRELKLTDDSIYNGFDDPDTELIIKKVMAMQRKTKAKKRILFVMDDILDSKSSVHSSKLINSLFANFRHYNINIIISTQHLTDLSPTSRRNCTYAFCHFTKDEET